MGAGGSGPSRRVLVPVEESAHEGVTKWLEDLFAGYLGSVREDLAVLLLRSSLVDLAHKVVGVGSVGTRALVILLEAGDHEPLILQVKEAGRSVLEDYLRDSRLGHHGQRVVVGQHLLQATTDPFLGWADSGEPVRQYYVRSSGDMKGSIDTARLDGGSAALRPAVRRGPWARSQPGRGRQPDRRLSGGRVCLRRGGRGLRYRLCRPRRNRSRHALVAARAKAAWRSRRSDLTGPVRTMAVTAAA